MRLGLFPEDAGHRIVVGPTEPRKFGANVSVHLLLAQNEETIVGVVRDEYQDVVEVISCCLCLDRPRVRLVEPVCTENPIRVDDVTESPKLAE